MIDNVPDQPATLGKLRVTTMRRSTILGLLAGVGLSSMAFSATAATLTFSPGTTYTVVYSNVVDGATLSASVRYTLTSINGTNALFAVQVTNSSSGAGDNRLASFAVDVVTPPLTGVSDDSAFWTAVADPNANNPGVNFPGFQRVDFCVTAGSVCASDAGGGLGEGQQNSFNLTVSFASAPSSVVFTSPFPIKWQSAGANGRSYEYDFNCLITTGTNCLPRDPLPEPGTLALLGLGLMGLGLSRRKRAA